MRYYKPISFALMFLILAVLALCFAPGCAMLDVIGQPKLQTYTFIYDGGEYSALLPKEVPLPPQKAQLNPDCGYPGRICAMHVWYMGNKPLFPEYPVATFWFTEKLGIVALIWHTVQSGETPKHIGWLYVKGLPISTNMEAFETFMEGLAGK